ncbi:Oidioi.mRNA.OKI2018_I69.chr1.g3139.t1.cds [Oikopleura dioica]|uniref:Oidioi.mRNA.OKI2018_I69.chr1.g3139.t1.cds n=1 Tax=Oikopleura dioica TaxID=34765 RepID=A0ABN7STV7_OIKDI|nr:Oidioi.mRNA.OKI2018_I69.chr1.g3139.t1.cds [Oikopleura dioica]
MQKAELIGFEFDGDESTRECRAVFKVRCPHQGKYEATVEEKGTHIESVTTLVKAEEGTCIINKLEPQCWRIKSLNSNEIFQIEVSSSATPITRETLDVTLIEETITRRLPQTNHSVNSMLGNVMMNANNIMQYAQVNPKKIKAEPLNGVPVSFDFPQNLDTRIVLQHIANTTNYPLQRFKYLHQGRVINQKAGPLDSNGIPQNATIGIVPNGPLPPRPAPPGIAQVQMAQNMPHRQLGQRFKPYQGTPPSRNLLKIEHKNPSNHKAYQRCQMMLVFMRNFEACLDFAEKNLDPDERPKFNDCLERVSNIPLVIEFGDILIKLAPLVRRWAILLSKLSDFCMCDPTAEQTNLEKQRRLIQSCMDACRYAWPLFNHMSRLIIPLQQEPTPHRFLVSA